MNSLGKSAHSSTCSAPVGETLPTQFRDAEIARLIEINRTQEIKIQALIQEVAYLRRMRYGVRNEAMSAEQRSLFEDDIHESHKILYTLS